MKTIASGSSSCGAYFSFDTDGLDSAVEWDDDRGLARWRVRWFADEVDDASVRCAAERGLARLGTEDSEARGAEEEEEAEELLPESGGG